jgi:hypothetical protein
MATYTQTFLLEHPICCFCGGGVQATTRDHVPAKIIFDGKHRPKGIEVPACERCQQYSKKHELVAAMVARIFPNSSGSLQRKEFKKVIQRAFKAVPGLLTELGASPEQMARITDLRRRQPDAAGVLNMGGPLMNESLDVFGIKMSCALHYEKTRRIVPIGVPISIRVYSNVDALDGNIPGEVIRLMGRPDTLRQGNWSVSNQFAYAYATAAGGKYAAYFATFRQSFAVLGFIWDSVDALPPGDGMKTFTPQSDGKYLRIR